MEERINKLYQLIHEKKNYLNDTDYIVIRAKERDEVLDEAFMIERQTARQAINDAEAEIAELEAQAEEEEEMIIPIEE